jgi:hypothetical protein
MLKETPAVAVLIGTLLVLLVVGLTCRLIARARGEPEGWISRLAPRIGKLADFRVMFAILSITLVSTMVFLRQLRQQEEHDRKLRRDIDEVVRLSSSDDFEELTAALLSESEQVRLTAASSLRVLLHLVSKSSGVSGSQDWCRELRARLDEWYQTNRELLMINRVGLLQWKDDVPADVRAARTFIFPGIR